MLAWQASAGDGEDAGAGVRWAGKGRDGATKDATCQEWRRARRRGGGGLVVAAGMPPDFASATQSAWMSPTWLCRLRLFSNCQINPLIHKYGC